MGSTQSLNEQTKINFLGNLYGFHDGYDGSVFGDNGVSPGIRAGATHIPHILVKVDSDDRCENSDT